LKGCEGLDITNDAVPPAIALNCAHLRAGWPELGRRHYPVTTPQPLVKTEDHEKATVVVVNRRCRFARWPRVVPQAIVDKQLPPDILKSNAFDPANPMFN
jgi:hypothetical protein